MALPTVQDILPDWPGWAVMTLSPGDVSSGQGTGQTLVKSVRDQVWNLHAESKVLPPSQIRFWKAKLDGLANGKRLFLGYDFASFFPAKYPKGSWPTGGSFDGVSAAINSIGTNGISISLSGVPAGFVGTIGDKFSITYGGGDPAALCLLETVEGFTANGSGVTPEFEVMAEIPIAVAEGDVVSLKRASCHMIISPGSVSSPQDKTGWGSITFDAIQVPTP